MRPEKHTKTPAILVLGRHRYDRLSGRLEDLDGNIVHLRAQSAAVLSVLAAHADEVVRRETLVALVWPDIATTEDSLTQCIADIRRTIGHESVETYPKRGYRLRPSQTGEMVDTGGVRRWLYWIALVFSVAVAIGVLVLRSGDGGLQEAQRIVPPPVSSDLTLAVLPFINLGDDPDMRFFSDGLSEDLTTELSKISELTVISHLSSFDYRTAEQGFRQIATDLGVRYLVRGTVRFSGAHVRINVALVDPYSGSNLWAERYDRDKGNPFGIQEEVTRQIVGALSLKLGVDQLPDRRVEPDAYYMLLRGLEPMRRLTPEGNVEARSYFERALEFDPQYARAYANIAVTYGREVAFRFAEDPDKSAIEKGLAAAITAIQLDPKIPSAYLALGVLNLAIGEYDNALAATRHAIHLDRNYSDGYALLAEVAVQGGDLDEALDAIRRAKLLHPHYPFSYDWIQGHIMFQLGQYGQAEALLQAAVERNPSFLRGLLMLAADLGMQGKVARARSALDRAKALKPGLSWKTEIAQMPYRFRERRQRLSRGLQEISSTE